MESRSCQLPDKEELVLIISKLEISEENERECLDRDRKSILVQIIGSFEKPRFREIRIQLYLYKKVDVPGHLK